jgi:RNA polymerase-binding transcription factor DksA
MEVKMVYYFKKAKKVEGGYYIGKCKSCGEDIIFRGGSHLPESL